MSTVENPTPTQQDNEQRRFTRVTFVSHITLQQGANQWNGTVVDISFNGLLVSSDANIVLAESLTDSDGINIVDASIHFENDACITTKLELAHHNGKLYGFSLHEIDSDSLTHLRNIIEHNLVDSGVCERELLALFRYHQ
jgi:hypothetical protein